MIDYPAEPARQGQTPLVGSFHGRYQRDAGLKVVVQFAKRVVYLLTQEETDAAGLPSRPPFHLPN
jgi:hypothetical protein